MSGEPVATAAVSALGTRVREERHRRGITLRALARDVGVSASMLSQIETGKTRPSVSTLYAITSALGISIEEVFAPATLDAPASVEVTAPGARQSLALETGVTWERLGEVAGRTVDFLRITYPPGAASSSSGNLMRHVGAEYGFVLSGELILTVDGDEIRVGAGEAVAFESTTPHSYRNEGDEPAVGVWFVLELAAAVNDATDGPSRSDGAGIE